MLDGTATGLHSSSPSDLNGWQSLAVTMELCAAMTVVILSSPRLAIRWRLSSTRAANIERLSQRHRRLVTAYFITSLVGLSVLRASFDLSYSWLGDFLD